MSGFIAGVGLARSAGVSSTAGLAVAGVTGEVVNPLTSIPPLVYNELNPSVDINTDTGLMSERPIKRIRDAAYSEAEVAARRHRARRWSRGVQTDLDITGPYAAEQAASINVHQLSNAPEMGHTMSVHHHTLPSGVDYSDSPGVPLNQEHAQRIENAKEHAGHSGFGVKQELQYAIKEEEQDPDGGDAEPADPMVQAMAIGPNLNHFLNEQSAERNHCWIEAETIVMSNDDGKVYQQLPLSIGGLRYNQPFTTIMTMYNGYRVRLFEFRFSPIVYKTNYVVGGVKTTGKIPVAKVTGAEGVTQTQVDEESGVELSFDTDTATQIATDAPAGNLPRCGPVAVAIIPKEAMGTHEITQSNCTVAWLRETGYAKTADPVGGELPAMHCKYTVPVMNDDCNGFIDPYPESKYKTELGEGATDAQRAAHDTTWPVYGEMYLCCDKILNNVEAYLIKTRILVEFMGVRSVYENPIFAPLNPGQRRLESNHRAPSSNTRVGTGVNYVVNNTNSNNSNSNMASIQANQTNIATNTTNISTNSTNIAANTTNIAANTTNIAANTTKANDLEAAYITTQQATVANAANVTSLTAQVNGLSIPTSSDYVAKNSTGQAILPNQTVIPATGQIIKYVVDGTGNTVAEDYLQGHTNSLAALSAHITSNDADIASLYASIGHLNQHYTKTVTLTGTGTETLFTQGAAEWTNKSGSTGQTLEDGIYQVQMKMNVSAVGSTYLPYATFQHHESNHGTNDALPDLVMYSQWQYHAVNESAYPNNPTIRRDMHIGGGQPTVTISGHGGIMQGAVTIRVKKIDDLV